MLDESGLHWQRVATGDAGRGGHFSEYQCIEHQRLTRLVQRANDSEPYVETYHVDGVAQYYHSAREALAAMKANP